MSGKIAIIGGGASGLSAAICAARLGADVALLERQARVGKKLLATGNGRCNLTNTCASEADYHGGTAVMAEAMNRFPPDEVIRFFRGIGVEPLYEGDKVYPLSEQASSVLDALRLTCDELGVRTLCDFDAVGIERGDGGFRVRARDGRSERADRLIIAAGGPSAPALGGTDAGIELMRALGFRCERTLPALVQLRCDPEPIRALTGIKFQGAVTMTVNGEAVRMEHGEVLFAEYGLSGPPILQLSRIASVAIAKRKRAVAVLHILPDSPLALLKERRDALAARPIEHFLTGMINKRLGQVLLKHAGIRQMNRPSGSLSDFELEGLAELMVEWPIEITDTQGFAGAQVATGGVTTGAFDPMTLEALAVPGLYACGEVLDVDGDCGGFNLQWAWASGMLAARSAALSLGGGEVC